MNLFSFLEPSTSYCLFETVLLFNLLIYNRETCHHPTHVFLFNRHSIPNSLTFLHGSVLYPLSRKVALSQETSQRNTKKEGYSEFTTYL